MTSFYQFFLSESPESEIDRKAQRGYNRTIR